ncbi:hypothetical protein K432DRAFT_391452 [Lepidopterella palustris CBS 459.81]|uniref:Uncharacterized protein n=1 Tax=Lepidopterella palustris CBS 459.81 TaxID=1314670 RepID=A0A8E2EEN9_9PEZI|nr:hypothetical protein K432DRAFT_391452 [Lepidopterella palustris CBS 459.81]
MSTPHEKMQVFISESALEHQNFAIQIQDQPARHDGLPGEPCTSIHATQFVASARAIGQSNGPNSDYVDERISSDPSSIVKLIYCILNFTCERLLGNEDTSHLFRVLAILRAETRRERATSYLDTIRRMLSMLHLEHSIETWFRNRAAASAGHELGDDGMISIPALKPDFYTLVDAREQLAAIGLRGLRYLEEQWYYRELSMVTTPPHVQQHVKEQQQWL